jgi:hypothetical protein
MIIETTEETHSKTGAKRVLVYEDDKTLIMLSKKFYEGEEDELEEYLNRYFDEVIFGEDSDSFCDGPEDG